MVAPGPLGGGAPIVRTVSAAQPWIIGGTIGCLAGVVLLSVSVPLGAIVFFGGLVVFLVGRVQQ